MDIQELAYELYKIDWMRRISPERQMDALRNYYQENVDDAYYSFEGYLDDQGYDGELYVCFDEFLGVEYQNREYIRELLDNEELYALYKQDLDRNELELT